MSIDIVLMKNKSEKNAVDKSLDTIATVTGTLRGECSIIDPVVEIEVAMSDITRCNYMYIDKFDRYYFVTNMTSVRRGLVRFNCHVDVLMSFKKGILKNHAIVRRQQSKYNLYLNDGSLKVYQNPHVTTKEFPSGFTTMEFVLAVAGS